MKAITKSYLIQIINREITGNISEHRKSKNREEPNQLPAAVTDEEILDFILTIPFFDVGLKDFLMGNIEQSTIIISQTWEIEYIIKVRDWGASSGWLAGEHNFLKDCYADKGKINNALTLPY